MADNALDFSVLFDALHVVGFGHLKLLTETAEALRERMVDAETADDQFAATHHILAVSQAMLAWANYLLPKEDMPERPCQTREAGEDD